MVPNQLSSFLERRYRKRLKDFYTPLQPADGRGIKENTHITVIGGGIAGSIFVRQLALEAHKAGKNINITLVNSTNCNYCGGLITNLAMDTLEELCNLDIPDDLVLKQVTECIYINKAGSVNVELDKPLTATLRTSRFGYLGFDDSVKNRVTKGLPKEAIERIEIIEPTLAKKVLRVSGQHHKWEIVLSKRNPDNTNKVLKTDIVVLACGFRSVNKPMLKDFQKTTGYQPPPYIAAAVTEVDTSKATKNLISNRMFILDGIIPDCVVAFIPKGPNWLTLTTLNKKLSIEDLDIIFGHPKVQEYIKLSNPSDCLRCHTICGAKVYLGESKIFYGDNWFVIGDLTGYGRVLKDGYFAAVLGAQLAAETLVHLGADAQSLRKGYHNRLKHFAKDNFYGRNLFKLNNWLSQKNWFAKIFILAAHSESRYKNGAYVHSAIRALANGELSYKMIVFLFAIGLIKHPLLTFRALMGGRNDI